MDQKTKEKKRIKKKKIKTEYFILFHFIFFFDAGSQLLPAMITPPQINNNIQTCAESRAITSDGLPLTNVITLHNIYIQRMHSQENKYVRRGGNAITSNSPSEKERKEYRE